MNLLQSLDPDREFGFPSAPCEMKGLTARLRPETIARPETTTLKHLRCATKDGNRSFPAARFNRCACPPSMVISCRS